MRTPELESLARITADRYGIRPALFCALIENESSWNEYAQRYEPAFMSKYVSPIFLKGDINATEAYSRAMSWGLCQVMGQTAREFGFTGHFLAELCAPLNGMEYGAKKLEHCLKVNGGDEAKALLSYNGGADQGYPARVFARIPNYEVIT